MTTTFAGKEQGLPPCQCAEYNFPDRMVDTELEQGGYLDELEQDG